jgi:hypothetical protein
MNRKFAIVSLWVCSSWQWPGRGGKFPGRAVFGTFVNTKKHQWRWSEGADLIGHEKGTWARELLGRDEFVFFWPATCRWQRRVEFTLLQPFSKGTVTSLSSASIVPETPLFIDHQTSATICALIPSAIQFSVTTENLGNRTV